ncbi:MAG: hypothetical protein ACXWWW_09355, partial [Candidatus Deferrimicrobiaceae bacterium]
SLGMSEFPSQGSGFGGDKNMANYIWIFPDGSYYIHLSGRSLNPLPFTVTCPDSSGPANQYVAAAGRAPLEFNDLFDTSSSLKLINNRMQGSYTVNIDGEVETSFTWDFGR